MPASFLCDRETVVVPKEQPGFGNFIVLPTWSMLQQILPGMAPAYERAQANIHNWTAYQETEEDKEVYAVKKPKKKSMNLLASLELDDLDNPS